MDTDNSQPKNKSRKGVVSILLVLLLIIGGTIGVYLYTNQHNKVQTLASQTNNLNSQLATLKSKLVSAESATNISTVGWKSYCDPYQSDFCFKYPSNWTLTDGSDSQFKYASATLTNPSNTLTMTYDNPYIKDDFPANFIAYSASSLSVSKNNLTLLGGYYVEAVEHTPVYAITNTSISSVKQGANITVLAVPVFQYNNNSNTAEITISPTNQNFTTTQLAKAWFDSVNGKTALAVMKSIYSQ
jgi:hypothetical protein